MFLQVLTDVVLGGQPLEPRLPFILSWLVAITIGLTVHEFAHAYAADRLGDPTPRANGRVSLNPLDHYDPIGTTMILLFGIGWGKPVPVNPQNYRKPRRDNLIVSAAGVATNLLVAVLAAIPIRFGLAGEYLLPLSVLVLLNLLLAFFNLLPLGPLDGAHVLESLLPRGKSWRFRQFSQQWGGRLLMLLIAADWLLRIPILSTLIVTPVLYLGRLLTGAAWLWF
ncbi:MAG: site-2 protease family protein [Armatimonadota bacterium]|nr:site-2 protease family protein [Armatimonadota bacterium]